MRAPLAGVFVIPSADDPGHLLAQVQAAEDAALDVVGLQDHPYQRRFLDTWTLLTWLTARTARIAFVPDVLSLPLRPPAMIAKAVASLDRLAPGRVELGLGAGAFWDAIAGFGGVRRSPGESVDALDEALAVIRALWSGDRATIEGSHYAVRGAHFGPVPERRIEIWLGALGPRMLGLVGRHADAWLPSLGWLDEIEGRQARIDGAARAAGRDPGDVRRIINLPGVEAWLGTEALDARSGADALDRVRRLGEQGFDGFLLAIDGPAAADQARWFGEHVATPLRAEAAA